MRKFFADIEGAVTVFVTLLLIPAILISGTAVDLARIHTARSIIQDANQLAANSVLTQYNAILYDIYGLLGVAQDDPILEKLLDEYIRVSVFGEDLQDRSLGTLQLFYGSNLSMEELFFPDDKNLRDEDVLRRQIEEYMKFRGPVLIVKEFLDALEGNNIKEDATIIGNKVEIESIISKIYDKYKELYNAITAADKCILPIGGISGGAFGSVSSTLNIIRNQFVDLNKTYDLWDSATSDYWKSDYAAKYKAILSNIRSYTVGGQTGNSWGNGRWGSFGNPQGLNKTIENAKQQADSFKPKFDAVLDISREIDALRGELSRKIDELETNLNSGKCSDDLKRALTQRQPGEKQSLIEQYRSILKWNNIEEMAKVFKDGGYSYIDDTVKPMLDGVMYRNANNLAAPSLTREELEMLPSNPSFALSGSVLASRSRSAVFAGFPEDSVTYKMPPGFLKYAEHPGRNRAFYNELKAMMDKPELPPVQLFDGQEEAEGKDGEEKQRNMIDSLLELVNTAYSGLTNDPLGAKYVLDSAAPNQKELSIFEFLEMIPEALNEPVLGVIQDPMDKLAEAGDYVLLLTYGTSVFSNYTTARPESIGKTRNNLDESKLPKSITGVPIGPGVNYFFQSEWEYLYNGSNNAGANLNAITRLLFLVRMICNYIKVFSVSEITTVVTSIRATFAWAPPLGIVLGELARAAFVAAETVIDVAALRSGHKAPLLKNVAAGEWICSPSGVVNAMSDLISYAGAGEKSAGEKSARNEKGLSYSNYMLFFFITKAVVYVGKYGDAATEFAARAGNLIEWNLINHLGGIKCDERKMSEALAKKDRFKLSEMKTDFSITTTVDLRMLFLSMVFAQEFSDSRGIGMPQTMPVRVTDYRGY